MGRNGFKRGVRRPHKLEEVGRVGGGQFYKHE